MKPGSVDKGKAMQQWEQLVNVYQQLQIKVEVINQKAGLPDMVFATDQGLAQGRKILMSRFRYKERRGETECYKQWFFEHAYELLYIPDHHFFEGNGDSFFWNDTLFVGTGVRSDKTVHEFLAKIFHHDVIPLHIIDPLFFHLDVGFFPLNNETIFYYPDAFTENSQKLLQKLVPNLIELTKEEVYGFSSNSVVTENKVIVQKDNPTFCKKLHQLGYETIEVDVGEFIKGGGGIHCLTNVLEEIEYRFK